MHYISNYSTAEDKYARNICGYTKEEGKNGEEEKGGETGKGGNPSDTGDEASQEGSDGSPGDKEEKDETKRCLARKKQRFSLFRLQKK